MLFASTILIAWSMARDDAVDLYALTFGGIISFVIVTDPFPTSNLLSADKLLAIAAMLFLCN